MKEYTVNNENLNFLYACGIFLSGGVLGSLTTGLLTGS